MKFFSRSTRVSYSAQNNLTFRSTKIGGALSLWHDTLGRKVSFSKPVRFFFIRLQTSSGVDTDASGKGTPVFDTSSKLGKSNKTFLISSHGETTLEESSNKSPQDYDIIGRHALKEKFTRRPAKDGQTQY